MFVDKKDVRAHPVYQHYFEATLIGGRFSYKPANIVVVFVFACLVAQFLQWQLYFKIEFRFPLLMLLSYFTWRHFYCLHLLRRAHSNLYLRDLLVTPLDPVATLCAYYPLFPSRGELLLGIPFIWSLAYNFEDYIPNSFFNCVMLFNALLWIVAAVYLLTRKKVLPPMAWFAFVVPTNSRFWSSIQGYSLLIFACSIALQLIFGGIHIRPLPEIALMIHVLCMIISNTDHTTPEQLIVEYSGGEYAEPEKVDVFAEDFLDQRNDA